MEISDFISMAALLVAILSAIYSKRAISVSERSNKIFTHHQLRPLRVAIYKSMRAFAKFCETYSTMQNLKEVKGTRDLVTRIESFKREIDKFGPLEMPEIEQKAIEFQKKAWQLQRILDRIAGGLNQSLDRTYETVEDNAYGIAEYFHNESNNLKNLFDPYLSGV